SLHDHVTIVLWNPATGEYKLVPRSHQPYENIEFNPRPLAFGYDHVTDDYKVIRIAQYPIYFEGNWICLLDTDNLFWKKDSAFPYDDDIFWEGWALRVYEPFWEIYSLKNNSWRKLDGIDVPVLWYALCEVNSMA
ncbi:F-box protein, partial [Trifolium medium]|nr:F-box protein [Trifolium medium]